MELDELKKSWQTLDRQLQKRDITTEEQVARLIESYKHKTGHRLGNLMSMQRASLCIGLLSLLILIAVGFSLPVWCEDAETRLKFYVILLFLALTLLGGGYWDWHTYHYIQQTRVDLMPIAEVSRRIVRLRLWARYEVTAISIWAFIFCAVYYWAMEFYRLPATAQVAIGVVSILFEVSIIYLLYKKLIYKHLNQIKKDIEDLKDVCTESH